MYKLCVIAIVSVALLTGCAITRSTITEYDVATGAMIKKTESSESLVKTVTESTKNKTVIVWEDGWAGYISVSPGTTEDPSPHGKIFVGKVNKGALSILPNQQGLTTIPGIVQATKSDISADLTGFNAKSSEARSINETNTVSE